MSPALELWLVRRVSVWTGDCGVISAATMGVASCGATPFPWSVSAGVGAWASLWPAAAASAAERSSSAMGAQLLGLLTRGTMRTDYLYMIEKRWSVCQKHVNVGSIICPCKLAALVASGRLWRVTLRDE